jgi:hypothetical protein
VSAIVSSGLVYPDDLPRGIVHVVDRIGVGREKDAVVLVDNVAVARLPVTSWKTEGNHQGLSTLTLTLLVGDLDVQGLNR